MLRFCYFFLLVMTYLSAPCQDFHVGGTMVFVDYLERECGVVFKENNEPKDAFVSMKEHGASIIRLTLSHPPFTNSYSPDIPVDWGSKTTVFTSIERAHQAGLEILLTFHYVSVALDEEDKLNPYVAPLAWQPIANDIDKLKDSVYYHTFKTLEELAQLDRLPSIVSISNESTYFILTPNVPESELGEYEPERSVMLLNAGAKAVRDISSKYQEDIKVSFHMTTPVVTKWWLETHTQFNPDMDILGLSIYPGWYKGDHAGYSTLGEYIEAMSSTYGVDLMIMETAQLFQPGGYDSHTNILGSENIPSGYPVPATTETQRRFMVDLSNEVKDAGGVGVIYWGGEWVGTDCYIFPDQWGVGSSWENKTFWDENYNLHDGVNWMKPFTGYNTYTFEVNMTDQDVSNGVYIIGDIQAKSGNSWEYIAMEYIGEGKYTYETDLLSGSSGSFIFSNGASETFHENISGSCVTNNYRSYEVSSRLEENLSSYVWQECTDELEVLGLDELDRWVEIYPNPIIDNSFTIKSNLNTPYIVYIYNISGVRLFKSSASGEDEFFNLRSIDLQSGIYLLQIKEPLKNISITKRIIIH